MVNPVSSQHLTPPAVPPAAVPAAAGAAAPAATGDQASFAGALRAQLEQVSRMQTEAEQGMEDLMAGRTDNITGVLTSARKAEVAFSLLMEIRNKLMDAYQEIRQMQV